MIIVLTATLRNCRTRMSLFQIAIVGILALNGLPANAQNQSDKPLNVLLFTADDLGYEAFPLLGGSTADVTPNLDRFAKSAMSFTNAHVNVAICAPSRSVIATGRYGHNSGCIGFNKLPQPIPTLFGTLQNAGYLTGILGKVSHSTTDPNFRWDYEHDEDEREVAGAQRAITTIVRNSLKSLNARASLST